MMETLRAERVWTDPESVTGVPTFVPAFLSAAARGTRGGFFDESEPRGKAAVEALAANASRWAALPHTLWIDAPAAAVPAAEVWYGSGDNRNMVAPFRLPNPSRQRRLAYALTLAVRIADNSIDPGEPLRVLLPCARTAELLTRREPSPDHLIESARKMIGMLWSIKGVATQFVVTDRRYDGRGYALQQFLDGKYGGGAHGPAGPGQENRVQGVNVETRTRRTRIRRFKPSSE